MLSLSKSALSLPVGDNPHPNPRRVSWVDTLAGQNLSLVKGGKRIPNWPRLKQFSKERERYKYSLGKQMKFNQLGAIPRLGEAWVKLQLPVCKLPVM